MSVFSMTVKDLQVFLRDRGSVFMLFLLPFVFILLLSLVSQGNELGSSGEELIPLAVVNNDPEGKIAQEFLDALADTQVVEIKLDEQRTVEEQLNQARLGYALHIPASFSAGFEAGHQVNLQLLLHPFYEQDQVMTIEGAIQRTIREYLMMAYLNKGLEQMGAMQAASPGSEGAFSEQRIQQQVEWQKGQAEQRPLIRVVESQPQELEEAQVSTDFPEIGQVSVVGMAVLFVFLGAQNTAMSFFKEKRVGSFRRLMAAPISKAAILGGKLVPNFLLSIVQLSVILVTGAYLVQLVGLAPLNLGSDPLGLVITSLAIALCATSLGIFIAAFVKTESQAGGISSLVLFMAGLLAGSFIPLFLFPEALENIARVVPHYWANQAYYGMIFRGETLLEIWPDVLALIIFSLAFFLVGLWRFRFD
jgi:ABC-2 type transport system permease protein